MKHLKLERPIAFIDVGATGLNVSSNRMVKLTILKIHPDGKEELKCKVTSVTTIQCLW